MKIKIPIFNLIKTMRGQSMVEMALSLPLLIMLATCAIDLGNLIYTTHRLSAAVREGAKAVAESSVYPYTPTPSGSPTHAYTLSRAAITRATRVLQIAGIDNANVTTEWVVREDRDQCGGPSCHESNLPDCGVTTSFCFDRDNGSGEQLLFLRVNATVNAPLFFRIFLNNQTLSSSAFAYIDKYDGDIGDQYESTDGGQSWRRESHGFDSQGGRNATDLDAPDPRE